MPKEHQTQAKALPIIRTKLISVIVPTFNGLALVQKHLDSWLANLTTGDEIIFADDHSSDQTVSWLVGHFHLTRALVTATYETYINHKFQVKPNKEILVKLMVNSENIRFAKNCNLAVELAQNELVFLLNNDVSLDENCLTYLEADFQKVNVFGVGCLEYEGATKTGIKSGKNVLWFEKGLFTHSRADNFESGDTAWVSGGSGLFDRHKWQILGGFDLKYYPAYWEDVDLSFRARKHGWRVLFNSLAIAYHQHESTNAKHFSPEKLGTISWHHSDYFTWKLAHFWQRMAFIIWRPYWWYLRLKPKQT